MVWSFRRIGIVVFIIITLALTVSTTYSWNEYNGVYRTVRNFAITVKNINFQVLNFTYASMEIVMPMQNPSDYSIKAFYITAIVALNGQYILTYGVDMWGTPANVPPSSNVTLTIKPNVTDPNKIQFITAQSPKRWTISLITWVEAPLVGRLQLTFRSRLTQ